MVTGRLAGGIGCRSKGRAACDLRQIRASNIWHMPQISQHPRHARVPSTNLRASPTQTWPASVPHALGSRYVRRQQESSCGHDTCKGRLLGRAGRRFRTVKMPTKSGVSVKPVGWCGTVPALVLASAPGRVSPVIDAYALPPLTEPSR